MITESFLPQVNGVAMSVARAAEQLIARGHQVQVVAPAPGPTRHGAVSVVRAPSLGLPRYPAVRVALSARCLSSALRDFQPDLVHLASPAVLGAAGSRAARRLGVPVVAVFQTDLARFATRYGAGFAEEWMWSWLRFVHSAAALTLAPSTPVMFELAARGFPRLALWGRGVDLDRFHPRRRSPELRRRLAPEGELLVGYVGRLAPEKEVHHLAHLHALPGVRLVVVGDGPERGRLQRLLPHATFTGFLHGEELARWVASLDVFVHTGRAETFGQTIQEALACGVPVLAPQAGGPIDLVRHDRNGWLWPRERPEAIRPMVAALAADPSRARHLAAGARPSVAGRSWQRLVEELEGHYRTVLPVGQRWRAA